MQVQEMLYVSAEAFYDQLISEIVYDVNQSTGRKCKANKLQKGFSYTKKMKSKMGGKGDVKVTITALERPKIYAAKFESKTGTNFLTYEIEKLEDEKAIGVTYREEFEGVSKTKKWNYNMVMFFYNHKSTKKAKRLLRNIENYLKQKEQPQAIDEQHS